MTVRTGFFMVLAGVCTLAGCPKNTEIANGGTQGGGSQNGTGGSGNAGAGSGSGSGTGGSHGSGSGGGSAGANGGPITLPGSGGSGGGSAGNSGGTGGSMSGGGGSGGGGTSCPPNIAIPALCRVCADGKCGQPACSGGTFTGFVCPNDPADAGTGTGGTGGGVCNLACVKGKHCELMQVTCVRAPCPAQPTCVDDTDGGATGSLHWVASCGTPVCMANPSNYDDPNIRNCTTEMLGQSCTTAGDRCDGVLGCGATYLCATQAPTTCPISRAKYKQEIDYLDAAGRAQYHDQITRMPLASYRYKDAPQIPQLGFIIDDIEPSVAVSGDHVNLYGYLSMAVAAIQVQDQQIKALQQELEQMRARVGDAAPQVCGPSEP